MENKEMMIAVTNMQKYIDEHLDEPITLKQLANVANYSMWHSARMFKALLGLAPFEYIRKLRLSQAALTLRDQNTKVIDVAFDFVFDSHEGFTKAFSKQFGMNPKKYSQETPPIPLFIPSRIYDHLLKKGEKKMNQTKTVFVQVVKRPARKVLLKRGIKATDYYAYCEEVGCDVWGVLTSVKEAMHEPVGMWLPNHLITPGTSVYVQGVELPLSYNKPIPVGFEMITLPECTMMIFQGEPFKDEDFEEAIESLWETIDKYNPKLYGYDWDKEAAPRFQLAPQGYRGYIEGRPVKSLSKSE